MRPQDECVYGYKHETGEGRGGGEETQERVNRRSDRRRSGSDCHCGKIGNNFPPSLSPGTAPAPAATPRTDGRTDDGLESIAPLAHRSSCCPRAASEQRILFSLSRRKKETDCGFLSIIHDHDHQPERNQKSKHVKVTFEVHIIVSSQACFLKYRYAG